FDLERYGRILGNIGFPLRPSRDYVNVEAGSAFEIGAGYELPAEWITRRFSFLATLAGETEFTGSDVEEIPFELLGGFRWAPVEGLSLQTAAGRGFTDGFGSPDFRIVFGLSWHAPKGAEPVPAPVDDDPDGDGLAGAADACPADAEDKDGHEDTDGCPDPDNDGDGISDAADKCPLEAENKNEVEDEDGCPEKDSDGDGILDAADKCPQEPEDKNGRDDGDGCPDGNVQIEGDRLKLSGSILFKTGSAELDKRSYGVLDEVAAILLANPKIKRVRIAGHTDDAGAEAANQSLSERRAVSVRDYLVARGLSASLFETAGFGESEPIDTNETPEGRAKNRRVEFLILEQGE
ncbi:MAG: OmpA family protein, partial [Bdellovibrionota bacterium]